MVTLIRLLIPAAAMMMLMGCNSQESSTLPPTASTADSAAAKPSVTQEAAPVPYDPGPMPKDGEEVAVIDTNLGQIVFRFYDDKAPKTVDNFKKLANKKFYDGTKFHRVIPGFMIQGGDPNSKGTDRSTYGIGGPGYTIEDERSPDLHHDRGVVSMANTGQPHSGVSQFFIMVADQHRLDGGYNVFGKVVKGMDVVDKIVNLPRDSKDDPNPGNEAVMQSVKIEKWPVK